MTPLLPTWLLVAPMLLLTPCAAFAAQGLTPEPPARTIELGRKNPFRPLVVPLRDDLVAPPVTAMPLPDAPTAPRPAPSVRPALSELEFRGVAYDEDEALAATRLDGKLRFLRVGDQVAGATLVTIAADHIVLRKNGRLLTKRLPTP